MLVEVKTNTSNTKSTKTILRHPEKYHVHQAIKLGDYNVGCNEQILALRVKPGKIHTFGKILRPTWKESRSLLNLGMVYKIRYQDWLEEAY